ncbi:MAG: Bug family tripartite tricarboxylate transporter substrate binding protein [Burkholderiales bacterium]
MRNFALIAALVMSMIASSPALHAADPWPTKPIRIVLPIQAGGGAPERVVRILANSLGTKWGVPITLEFKPSAGLILGTEFVARAAPDGHTLLSTLTAHVQTPYLFKKLPFDTLRDFIPVTQTVSVDMVYVVKAEAPYRTLKDFLAAAKNANPPLSYGSTGQGSSYHLFSFALSTANGANMLHVPYKGEALALTDVLGGRIDSSLGSFPSTLPHIKSGRLRALAVAGTDASPIFPGLPSINEFGIPKLHSWFGVLAPRGTPAEVVQKIYLGIREVLTDSEVAKTLFSEGIRTVASSPEDFARLIESELGNWRKIIAETGLKPQE